MTDSSTAGVIHDLGYQRYQGERLGRGYAARSLYLHGLRATYGLGRSAKAKVFPWLVVAVMLLPAVVSAAVRALTDDELVLMSYSGFPDMMSTLVVLFCAVVAPELVCRDLRNGTLPLYFSRPLRRSDYALVKLGALVTAVWLLLAGPQLLMFGVAAFTVEGLGSVWDEFLDFLPGLGHSATIALVFSSISLLVAALVSRRAVAAGLVVAAFLVTTPVVGALEVLGGETVVQLCYLLSPMTLVVGVRQWLIGTSDDASMEMVINMGDYGPIYGATALALVGACVGLLLVRYRRIGL